MPAVLFVLLALIAAVVVVAGVVLARAVAFRPPGAPAQDTPDFDPGPARAEELERLGAALRIPTVSHADYEATDFAPFAAFKEFLAASFPLFHERCELEVVNGYALIYRWPGVGETRGTGREGDGEDAGGDDGIGHRGGALDPVALMAHYDVVPVEEGAGEEWRQPPFSGAVVDGVVWGRGALDVKSQLMAHLEAAESLMRAGFAPRRDVYFCYGHDEETGGQQGAAKVVEHFAGRGVRFAGVLDEGGMVIRGALAGVGAPLGLIGMAEKGLSNYRFKVEGAGGHSSTPLKNTSLGLAAQLITLIERRPMPLRLIAPVEAMLRNVAGEMGFGTRLVMANLWLFRPLLVRKLAADPTTNAMVRTTFAVTMASASDAANVLPQTSRFVVNVRILPGDTTEDVRRHFAGLIARTGFPAVAEPLLETEPSPASRPGSDFYRSIEQLIHEFYPSALVTPYVMVGGTDARRFHALSENVLRFTPFHLTGEDLGRLHNANESLSWANYGRMIAFYESLLRQQ
ncbi:MAG: M20/M25/M40 family metallo-hydrolase [Bifidobacteriaceae bacterium]|jgi:carboxypeptidase PM20D1|nr:M20/M25/M40 family metallo-hydrolase [Bifidobacteriaceae bacterium]